MEKEFSMKSVKLLTLTATIAFSTVSLANESISKLGTQHNLENNIAIKSIAHQKQIAWAFAPVKTADDLHRISHEESPLDALSPMAKERFIESVIFRSNGLGGFYFGDLEAELTPTQIYNILALFGAQNTVSKFNKARIETKADMLLLSSPTLEKFNSKIQNDSDFVSPQMWADHKGYRCSGRATCRKSPDEICMTGC
jgi:hypothetical protein